ncbi:transcriptional adapter 2-beta [Nematocida major]|uniref:transcriptional adapter 2-beta n=1 Tax=Nematocida major TaxID=1912982 RepID=UPI0020084890|nr:transcriptional adapter 2-beta [Nematocida major]KAH9385939.1 transcriptional adapter 2-beta [Nematocida major]
MVVTHSQMHGNACLIRCDGCLMNISSIMWIQCVQCHIDICPLCVVQRAQIRTHEYTHRYRVIKSLSFEVDSLGWQMIEENLFIDGLIVHGIGNWADISAYIGQKTPSEVKEHFSRVFNQPNCEALEGEAVQNVQSLPLSQEISGYMPLRQDFEVEYMNDAELAIKEISFSKTDTSLEKETKEILLESYRNTLLQRKLFRTLIFDKGLLSAKQHMQKEKLMCSAGKELLAKIKPLLKMLPKEEYLAFFQGLYLEQQIRMKVSGMSHRGQDHSRGAESFAMKKLGGLSPEDAAAHYLSENEHAFCNMVSIPPTAYYYLKEAAILCGTVTEAERKHMLKGFQGLSEQKLNQVLSYLMKNKWIELPAA